MISTVSFKGTFKVNNKDQDSFEKFQKYAYRTYELNEELENSESIGLSGKFVQKDGFGNFGYRAELTLVVPDYMDTDVETFCANNGISFKKYETDALLDPKTIISRIADAPKGYTRVSVDVKKLEELAKKQNSNLEHCRSDYDEYYSDEIDTMLKLGDEIPATTLFIRAHGDNENLKSYVDRFGVNNLNNGQLYIDFGQRTNNPDHCIYFALKDLGINKIPVYVDKQSLEAGSVLGLF